MNTHPKDPASKKRPHWTQTAEGKRYFKERRAMKAVKTQSPHTSDGAGHGTAIQDTPLFNYLLGRIEERIEIVAQSTGVSSETLAAELGKILSLKTRRRSMGS